jgi:hypothetical protein
MCSWEFHCVVGRRGMETRTVATKPSYISQVIRRAHCKEPILKIQNKYSQRRNCAATVQIFGVCERCIPRIDLPSLEICGPILEKYRHMHVEIGTEAAPFPEKEYISGIFVAVQFESRKRGREPEIPQLGDFELGSAQCK